MNSLSTHITWERCRVRCASFQATCFTLWSRASRVRNRETTVGGSRKGNLGRDRRLRHKGEALHSLITLVHRSLTGGRHPKCSVKMTTNTVTFPSPSPAMTPPASSETQSLQPRHPALSVSCHTSAIEVCDLVYSASISSWDGIERFYEPNATYENPFVTATSRTLLADIHTVASHLSQIDVPKPIAVLHALFGLKKEKLWTDPWFSALSVWSEIGDVCESESFGE